MSYTSLLSLLVHCNCRCLGGDVATIAFSAFDTEANFDFVRVDSTGDGYSSHQFRISMGKRVEINYPWLLQFRSKTNGLFGGAGTQILS
jgi:hypothetical protein